MLGDNKACTMASIRKIKLGLEDGSERILWMVRYVLDLKRNLISLGILDREGYSFKSQDRVLSVSRGSLLYMKGALIDRLYALHGKTLVGEVAVIIDLECLSTNLWHRRLGHLSEKGLYKLSKQGLLGIIYFLGLISMNTAYMERPAK